MDRSKDSPYAYGPLGSDDNPYRPPVADLSTDDMPELQHIDASRWLRLAGALVDGLLTFVAVLPGFIVMLIFSRATSDAVSTTTSRGPAWS